MEVLHHPGSWRTGTRDLGIVPAEFIGLLRSGRLETRLWIGLGDGILRPRVEPELLGDRKRRPRLQSRPTPWREPVYGLRGGARYRYRKTEVVLPVHPAR